MYQATKHIHFCYGHRLLNYVGKCKNLHGHNARAEIKLGVDRLDDRAMVVDFDDIERVIKSWIDENIDHKMLLAENDPLLPVLRDQGVACVVMTSNPTAEAIARTIYECAVAHGFPVVEVTVWETESSCATYRAGGEMRGRPEAERGMGTDGSGGMS